MACRAAPARLYFRLLPRSVAPQTSAFTPMLISISMSQAIRIRNITTGRPSFPPPPPARRHYERAVLTKPPPARSTTPPRPTLTSTKSPAPPPSSSQQPGIARRPTDRQIPFSRVYVVDPDTGALSRTKHSLEELLAAERQKKGRGSAEQGEGAGEGKAGRERRVIELVASSPQPIVRITTRREVEARYKEMKRALKKGARTGGEAKEVRFTWGVAPADMEHKLRKARRDLEKGYRVVVSVAMKYRQRPSSRQELIAFADEIAEALGEVGEEWKEREITQRLMTLSFRGRGQDGDGS